MHLNFIIASLLGLSISCVIWSPHVLRNHWLVYDLLGNAICFMHAFNWLSFSGESCISSYQPIQLITKLFAG